MEKKKTSRQLQAERTKQKLYAAGAILLEKGCFSDLTIEQITKKAGVSVGSFYYYFKTKEDLLYDIYRKSDEYFKEVVAPVVHATKGTTADRIVLYFDYYAQYNASRGFDNIKHLFNTKNKFFAMRERFMYVLLVQLIEEGQEKKELTRQMSAEEATDFLCIAGRGVIYDWCIHGGMYDLEAKMKEYMSTLVKVLVKKRTQDSHE